MVVTSKQQVDGFKGTKNQVIDLTGWGGDIDDTYIARRSRLVELWQTYASQNPGPDIITIDARSDATRSKLRAFLKNQLPTEPWNDNDWFLPNHQRDKARDDLRFEFYYKWWIYVKGQVPKSPRTKTKGLGAPAMSPAENKRPITRKAAHVQTTGLTIEDEPVPSVGETAVKREQSEAESDIQEITRLSRDLSVTVYQPPPPPSRPLPLNTLTEGVSMRPDLHFEIDLKHLGVVTPEYILASDLTESGQSLNIADLSSARLQETILETLHDVEEMSKDSLRTWDWTKWSLLCPMAPKFHLTRKSHFPTCVRMVLTSNRDLNEIQIALRYKSVPSSASSDVPSTPNSLASSTAQKRRMLDGTAGGDDSTPGNSRENLEGTHDNSPPKRSKLSPKTVLSSVHGQTKGNNTPRPAPQLSTPHQLLSNAMDRLEARTPQTKTRSSITPFNAEEALNINRQESDFAFPDIANSMFRPLSPSLGPASQPNTEDIEMTTENDTPKGQIHRGRLKSSSFKKPSKLQRGSQRRGRSQYSLPSSSEDNDDDDDEDYEKAREGRESTELYFNAHQNLDETNLAKVDSPTSHGYGTRQQTRRSKSTSPPNAETSIAPVVTGTGDEPALAVVEDVEPPTLSAAVETDDSDELTEHQIWQQQQQAERDRYTAEISGDTKDTSFFLMPACFQESEEIVKKAMCIDFTLHPDEWKDRCTFHDGTGVVNCFTLSSTAQVIDPSNPNGDAEREWQATQALNGWNPDNFLKVARFLKLTSTEWNHACWHPRWRTNFPSIPGRWPYFFQVYGAVLQVEPAYKHSLAILADKMGVGKSTTSIIWSRVILNNTLNLLHMLANPEQHLDESAERDVKCPTADDRPFQCLCEKSNMFHGIARPIEGHTIEVQDLQQFRDPWLDEIKAIHQPSDWNPRTTPCGIAGGEPVKYHAVHHNILAGSTVPQEEKDFFKSTRTQDLVRIAGSFYTKAKKSNGKPRARATVGPDGVLNKAEAGMPGFTHPDEEESTRDEWCYEYGNAAKYETFGMTPQGLKKLADLMGGRVTRWEKKRYARECTIRRDKSAFVSALPGIVKVDEAHKFMGKHSGIEAFLNQIKTAFENYEGAYPPIVLLQTGTWAPQDPAASISTATLPLEEMFDSFPSAEMWFDMHAKNHYLGKDELESLQDETATFLSEMHTDFQKKCKRDPTAKWVLTRSQRKQSARLNRAVTRVTKLVVLQRSMSTRMFGQQIGQEAPIHVWYVESDQERTAMINEPVLGNVKEIAARIAKLVSHGAASDEARARVLASAIVGSRRARISAMLPGYGDVNTKMSDYVKQCLTEENPMCEVTVDPGEDDDEYDDEEEQDEEGEGEGKTTEKKTKKKKIKVLFNELEEEQKDKIANIKFLNGEMNRLGWNRKSLWPAPPHEGTRKVYEIALGLQGEEADQAAIKDRTKATAKYQIFGIWVRDVLTGKNKKGQQQAGMMISQNTWILHSLRAWLWDVLSDEKSVWYVGPDAKYQVMVIDAAGWTSDKVRCIAAKFANHKHQDVFFEERGKLDPGYQEGHPEHIFKNGWFPHILLGGTILATGISMARHTSVFLAEPFAKGYEIDQASGRSNRIDSIERSWVVLAVQQGGIYDQYGLARWRGPMEAYAAEQQIAKALRIDGEDEV